MPNDPPSPCTGICLTDASAEWCSACRRTLDEIAAWSSAPSAFKREVLARLAKRAWTPATPGK